MGLNFVEKTQWDSLDLMEGRERKKINRRNLFSFELDVRVWSMMLSPPLTIHIDAELAVLELLGHPILRNKGARGARYQACVLLPASGATTWLNSDKRLHGCALETF